MKRFVKTLDGGRRPAPHTVSTIDAAENNNRRLRTDLSGFNEVHAPSLGIGAIFSTGSGRLTLKIDRQNREIGYELSYEFPDASDTPVVGAAIRQPGSPPLRPEAHGRRHQRVAVPVSR